MGNSIIRVLRRSEASGGSITRILKGWESIDDATSQNYPKTCLGSRAWFQLIVGCDCLLDRLSGWMIGWRPGGKAKIMSTYTIFWRLRRLGGKRGGRIIGFTVCLDTFRSVIVVVFQSQPWFLFHGPWPGEAWCLSVDWRSFVISGN